MSPVPPPGAAATCPCCAPAGEESPGLPPPGSLAQEAVLLAEAVRVWMAEHGASGSGGSGGLGGSGGSGAGNDRAPGGSPGEPPGGAWACQLCPLCRLVASLAAGRPEAAAHLMEAATAVAGAVGSLRAAWEAATHPGDSSPGGTGSGAAGEAPPGRERVQRIDIR